MMNLLPTSYFPSIFYLQNTQNFNPTFISGNEIYGKQSFRNRCEIQTGNGIQALSVPVVKPDGSKSLTKDIKIIDSNNWQIDHWRAIKSAYQNAPYFEYYDLEIHDLIFSKSLFLMDLNEKILDFISSELDLKTIPINSELKFEIKDINFLERKPHFKIYTQVFSDRFGFQSNLSFLDLLFCEGPMARNWILEPPK